ncbi:MAG: ion channel [Deltaproteobacteria bacterium]
MAQNLSNTPRLVNRQPVRRRVVRLGLQPQFFRDFYHFWLMTPWPWLVALVLLAYAGLNAAFAGGYLALGDALENARPGSFTDAFFFSVQTMATIGYGKMVPQTIGANILVTLESLFGLLGFSVITGLVFAKFARPTARVLFSRIAVVSMRDGVPSLMFRIANERTNQIVDAQIRVVVARNEQTVEGEPVRRFHPLELSRGWATFFSLTWTVIHPITEKSPLHGRDSSQLEAENVEIIVLITGVDETFSQTIHARYSYVPSEIVWGGRFVDVLARLPDGRWEVDYTKFHEAVVAGEPKPA